MSSKERQPTVSDFIVERLHDWGVRRIFGFPGDGINGVIGALARAQDRVEFVQTAHEELASLMACAHAKYTGEVGVCLATSGPGAIHLLNGLYDAKLDHVPVVAIIGQQGFAGVGGSTQQETDLHSLLESVASAYLTTIGSAEQARHAIDRAFRTARGRRTVAAIIVPHDIQREPAVEEPARKHGRQHSSPGWWEPRVLPKDADLRQAAAILNAGKRVALLVGAGALGTAEAVTAVAERLGAGVCKAMLGKAVLPDDIPWVTGSVGWLGTAASNRMMEECDTLLMVGSTMPYTEFLPKEGQARGVQVDLDPQSLGLRYPMEVALVGDARETLEALLPLLQEKRDRAWRAQVEDWTADWWRTVEQRADAPADPVNPQLAVRELSRRLPHDAILAGDCGSSTVWLARDVVLREGMLCSLSGGLATMGGGIPYALAAKMAYPGRPAFAIVGDGAVQMSGMSALIDVAKYWRRWRDPRLVVLVLNNRDLNYVSWEQRVMEGEPRFPGSQDLPDIPYAKYAALLGLAGARVERPEQLAAACDAALAADRPFVLDVVVDPDVPTLPPVVRKEQEEKLAKALDAGDADAEGVREQLALQQIEGE